MPQRSTTSTGRDLIAVTSVRVALLAVWFGATVLAARVLGPKSFGLYTLCQNAIRLFTGCFAEPLDMAVMRSVPLHLQTDRPRALAVLRAAFWLRVAAGLLPLLPALITPFAISWLVFGQTQYGQLALLTAIGIGGDLLLRSALGYFQVSLRFGPFLLVDVIWQLSRAIAMVALAVTGVLTARWAVGIYIIAPYAAFAAALLMLPSDVRSLRWPARADVLEVLHYGKWMTAALAITAVYERLDLFLLQHFRGAHDVGVYAGALTLALVPDFFSSAMQTVLSPRIAPAHAAGTFRAFHKRYLVWAAPLGIALLALAIVLAGPLFRLLFSTRFAGGANVFRLLLVGTVFNMVFTPLPEALLNFINPRLVLKINAAGLVIVAIGGVLMIPRYGPMGAASIFVAARVVTGTLQFALAGRASAAQQPPTAPLPQRGNK